MGERVHETSLSNETPHRKTNSRVRAYAGNANSGVTPPSGSAAPKTHSAMIVIMAPAKTLFIQTIPASIPPGLGSDRPDEHAQRINAPRADRPCSADQAAVPENPPAAERH